jgi:hypothetical protein
MKAKPAYPSNTGCNDPTVSLLMAQPASGVQKGGGMIGTAAWDWIIAPGTNEYGSQNHSYWNLCCQLLAAVFAASLAGAYAIQDSHNIFSSWNILWTSFLINFLVAGSFFVILMLIVRTVKTIPYKILFEISAQAAAPLHLLLPAAIITRPLPGGFVVFGLAKAAAAILVLLRAINGLQRTTLWPRWAATAAAVSPFLILLALLLSLAIIAAAALALALIGSLAT